MATNNTDEKDLDNPDLNNPQEQASPEDVKPTDENQAEVETTEEQEEIEEELSAEEKLQIEVAAAKDKYLRLYSEFENFRRRNAKERLELVKTASADLITDLLPVVDDFERATKAYAENENKTEMLEGVKLINNKFIKALEGRGLQAMESKPGIEFDTELHEAITKIPAPSKKLKGKVVDVVEKGYLLNEKVIRYAKVVIGE